MRMLEYWTMDYHELDYLINTTYKPSVPYEMVAFEELNNDSSWTAMALKKEPLSGFDEADVQKFRETGKIKNWRTRTLLQDMVNNNVLPEGNFLVEVSW